MASSEPSPNARFVSRTKYRSRPGSIHSDVPVKPTCPNALDDIRVPHDEVGSIVSQPNARELPGTGLRAENVRSSDGVNGGGPEDSPRAAARTTRAKRPTPLTVPKSPA